MSRQLRLTKFRNLSLGDPFFSSLRSSYGGFADWFRRKADEDVYVVTDGRQLTGMVYLKAETGPIRDVRPSLPRAKWLKVGTLKIDGRGTKLGERVLKKILDVAIADERDGIYVTVFHLHPQLINLFERYGFRRLATKASSDGIELVLVRYLNRFTGDIVQDYPFLHTAGRKAWLLAVYPDYHSRLLPDSILNNEPREIVQDVSYTNTIHKAYVGRVSLCRMQKGDLVVIYRTTDRPGHARFRSVATSICVIEEVKRKRDFDNFDAFLRYTRPHSVFTEEELRRQYSDSKRLYVAKMTYNAAFGRRTIRQTLLDEVGITEKPRWDLRELSAIQLSTIMRLGEVDARLIID